MAFNIIDKAQKLLDTGQSHLKTAILLGVSESSIKYHLRKGTFKKALSRLLQLQQGNTPSDRNSRAISDKDILGIGANWVMAMALAAKGKLNGAPIIFVH